MIRKFFVFLVLISLTHVTNILASPRNDDLEIFVSEQILKNFGTDIVQSRFDSKVFTPDFWLAVQFQESRFNPKAVSHKGAKGDFQVTPIAVQAVIKYYYFLKQKKALTTYHGPKKISFALAKKVCNLFASYPEYCEVFGKSYFVVIHDPEYIWNKKKDFFRGKPIWEQRARLLYSYNAGPKYRYKKPLSSSVLYANNIFVVMDKICFVRQELRQQGYNGRELKQQIKILMRTADKKGNLSVNHLRKLIKQV